MNPRPVMHFTGESGYPQPPPFHPGESYPELGALAAQTTASNPVYAGVRALLQGMDYDARHRGSAAWNPLSDLVSPGGVVVLKPNFVLHYNEDADGSIDPMPCEQHCEICIPVTARDRSLASFPWDRRGCFKRKRVDLNRFAFYFPAPPSR